jgi:hypothetical protein
VDVGHAPSGAGKPVNVTSLAMLASPFYVSRLCIAAYAWPHRISALRRRLLRPTRGSPAHKEIPEGRSIAQRLINSGQLKAATFVQSQGMHIRFRDGQLNHLATAVGEKVETGVEQGTAMSAATRRGLHPHGANVANAVYVARRRHEAPVRPKDEHGHSRDAKALGTGAPSVITQRCGV